MVDTSGLWHVYRELDGTIWAFKYDLQECPKLDDHLREILESLKKEIEEIEE